MFRSVITAVFIGVLGGLWLALRNDSIEVFQNYVDGVWRYQFAVRSFAAPLIGMVIGALAGANIQLALSPERAVGFMRGALIGAAVGILLVLAQVILVALAANLGAYRVPYQALLTRFGGIVFLAAAAGAAMGLLTRDRPPVGILPNTIAGALVGASFALPVIISVTLIIVPSTARWSFMNVLPFMVSPIVGAAVAAIIAAVSDRLTAVRRQETLTFVAVMIGALAGVTASSTSFAYVIRQRPYVFYEFHIAAGLLIGVAAGIAALALLRRMHIGKGNSDMLTSCE